MSVYTRRDALLGSVGALAGAALVDPRRAPAEAATGASAPKLEVEKGAVLRVMRPSKFVAGDEQLFMQNTQKFTERTGVDVKVEMQAWEDLRPKTAVAANVGSGPDIVLAWLDDPHQYPDKLLDLTEVATYIGDKYGGWFPVAETYGRTQDGRWIAMPIGAGGGCITYRKSWLNEAGFDAIPTDFPGLLKVCQALKAKGHPPGLALGNAVGDGNAWTYLVLWGFGSSLVDENNRVVIDAPKTIEALEYAKELYATFIGGTLAWLDPSNNKAFLAGDIGLTHNGISIYYVAKNSQDPTIKAMADDIYHARPPVGPVGRPTETSLIVNTMAFKHTKYPNAAKAYLLHMFEGDQYAAWQEACIGYWQPTLKIYDGLPFWTTDPKLTPYRDIVKNMLPYCYKGRPGPASAAVLADYIVVNMFAKACLGQASPAAAAKEAQRRAERYYKA
jgi:multiple sugar transport system substrate-binding protein